MYAPLLLGFFLLGFVRSASGASLVACDPPFAGGLEDLLGLSQNMVHTGALLLGSEKNVNFPTFLPEQDRTKIRTLLDYEGSITTRRKREEDYSLLVRAQVMRDLSLLYNSPRTQVTYASFTSEDNPGEDGGFGLHVVKRVDIGDKTVFVNEHWPFRRGRLQLPDEIRARTRGFNRDKPARGAPGSEDDYIVERFRIAYDVDDKPTLFTQRQFGSDGKAILHRVSTGSFDCTGCHKSGNGFAASFTPSGAKTNAESNTQRTAFAPLSSSTSEAVLRQGKGFEALMAYLKKNGYSAQHRNAMESALLKHPQDSLRLPGFAALLDVNSQSSVLN